MRTNPASRSNQGILTSKRSNSGTKLLIWVICLLAIVIGLNAAYAPIESTGESKPTASEIVAQALINSANSPTVPNEARLSRPDMMLPGNDTRSTTGPNPATQAIGSNSAQTAVTGIAPPGKSAANKSFARHRLARTRTAHAPPPAINDYWGRQAYSGGQAYGDGYRGARPRSVVGGYAQYDGNWFYPRTPASQFRY